MKERQKDTENAPVGGEEIRDCISTHRPLIGRGSEEEMCKCVDTFYTNYVIVLLWKPYIYIRDYIETTMD